MSNPSGYDQQNTLDELEAGSEEFDKVSYYLKVCFFLPFLLFFQSTFTLPSHPPPMEWTLALLARKALVQYKDMEDRYPEARDCFSATNCRFASSLFFAFFLHDLLFARFLSSLPSQACSLSIPGSTVGTWTRATPWWTCATAATCSPRAG